MIYILYGATQQYMFSVAQPSAFEYGMGWGEIHMKWIGEKFKSVDISPLKTQFSRTGFAH